MAGSNAALGQKALGLGDERRPMRALRYGIALRVGRRLLRDCRQAEYEMECEAGRKCNAEPGVMAQILQSAKGVARCPDVALRAIAF